MALYTDLKLNKQKTDNGTQLTPTNNTCDPGHLDTLLVPQITHKTSLESSEAQRSPNQISVVTPHKIDKQSLEYILKGGLAGGVAGCAAKTLIAPLDRIKILFQTQNPDFKKFSGSFKGLFQAGNHIKQTDGLIGLFQGHSATLLRVFPYAAIKYISYEQIKSILIPSEEYDTQIRRGLSGSLSGVLSVFFTYPLDLLRVRLAYETKSTFQLNKEGKVQHNDHYHKGGRLVQTVWKILAETPPTSIHDPLLIRVSRKILPESLNRISNFYRGFTLTIIGILPYAGVAFWAHDLVQDFFRLPMLAKYAVLSSYDISAIGDVEDGDEITSPGRIQPTVMKRKQPLNFWAEWISGAIAGLVSQTASYPFEVTRRHMQVGGVSNGGKYVSAWKIAANIWNNQGYKGFFVGLTIGYLKVVPMVATSFFVYERMKYYLRIYD